MSMRRYKSTSAAAMVLAIAMLGARPQAQAAAQAPATPAAQANKAQGKAGAGANPTGAEISLDRVVAIVNGDLILDSDVDAEQRFAAFQPFSIPEPVTREQLIDRLIDRALILQQMALQPEPPISDAEVDAELATLRKAIPKCTAAHCETEAGWQKFVADQGFTQDELRERWRQRMEVLRFVEQRFRMGIRILPPEIDDYYKNTMLPVYQREGVTPPAEASIADKIQEILLQQRVDKLLDDWLTSLRAQGSVQIMKPGEEAP
jgi:peptidyl-prolyl cis-trans isomerase SurA